MKRSHVARWTFATMLWALCVGPALAQMAPGTVPHYYGPYANYANSPLRVLPIAVNFTGGGGTGASAMATVDPTTGAITAIAILDPGTGYTSAPTVSITGVGTGAAATATIDGTGAVTGVTLTSGGTGYIGKGIQKFVNSLAGLGPTKANDLGQYIPVAVPDTTTYSGSDYYEIGLVEYQEQMHRDLLPTRLRGYVQLSTGVVPGNRVALTYLNGNPITVNGQPVYAVDNPHYLGPAIVAQKDRPVRILFRNLLPTGQGGNLFLPVDTTVMGAGRGPSFAGTDPDPQNPECGKLPKPAGCYTENRATLHLHGGITPWISDGTPHQWITPAGESTPYPKGVSVSNVPDMPDPGAGAQTFFYTNQQSARLLFYHDHAWGITRLNVYAGEAAPYLIGDPTETKLVNSNLIPGAADTVALVLQDKTFVPATAQLQEEDPTWDIARWGGEGNLWMPHVYMPAQNPGATSGANDFGRWAYGPWFWPPTLQTINGPIPNPYYDPACDPDLFVCEPPEIPGTPNLSFAMESFQDTPVVNGTAYPYTTVEPKAYRFRILNAANDRFFNLSLYVADPAQPTEVALNAAELQAALTDTAVFPTPDTTVSLPGPNWIQIGTEGGFLPAPVVIPPQPITWVTDPTVFNAGNVDKHSLLVGPAERADVIVDFSAFAGKTIILYNDAPAAFPARDARYDYYTGSADLTGIGGVPPIAPGYGPNTRTVMQIRVAASAPAPAFNVAPLAAAFAHQADGSGVFESSQHPIVVGQSQYNSAYGTTFPTSGVGRDGYARITDFSLTFNTLAGSPLTFPLTPKAIQDEMGEAFDPDYGRMSGNLGVEAPQAAAGALAQNLILYPYVNPPTENLTGIQLPPGASLTPITTTTDGSQLWKITHNGVDTHPIHFHLFDVQLINRVGWDGIIRKPEPNEVGWKDTVRISPLEDTIVALRPLVPQLPFGLPNSSRPLNPALPIGSTMGFQNVDVNGNPISPPIANVITNFGWEYVWHCHILSHEEMDMMRPIAVSVTSTLPTAPVLSVGRTSTSAVILSWTDATPVYSPAIVGNTANEVGFRIQRAPLTGNNPTWTTITTALANTTTYRYTAATANYRYRVQAFNTAGNATSNVVASTSTIIAAATGVTLTASIPSPQPVGSAVRFTAQGQGSVGPYEYRFWLYTNGQWNIVQDYGISNAWTLPTNLAAGTYSVSVHVRTRPNVAYDAVLNPALTYTLTDVPPTPATGVTLTASRPSPQVVGTAVVFSAQGQGSTGPYQYRFWLYQNGQWNIAQDYSLSNTWTLPTNLAAGTYYVSVHVRTSATVDYDAVLNPAMTYVLSTVVPATGVTLTASVPSPQPVGTAVTFTAQGQGAPGPYEYRFWIYRNGAWEIAQDYGIGNTWTLPTNLPAGWYGVSVHVRTSNLVEYDAVLNPAMGYVLQ